MPMKWLALQKRVHVAGGNKEKQDRRPGAAVAKPPRRHYKSALGDLHGPITPAEPSACATLGTAAISLTSGTKNITTTGVHNVMPETQLKVLQ